MKPDVYDEIWQTFINGDHISPGSIWGGEGLALIVPVAALDVLANVMELQTGMADCFRFTPHSPEDLHITLALLGDPPQSRLPSFCTFLQLALHDFPAFPIHLMRINSFFRAPFLEVHEEGALNRLLALIQPGLELLGCPKIDYGSRGQVWHVTLGGYADASDGVLIREVLKDFRDFDAGAFRVEEVFLVRTSPGAPYRMNVLNTISLKKG